jgi:hypothetical protein
VLPCLLTRPEPAPAGTGEARDLALISTQEDSLKLEETKMAELQKIDEMCQEVGYAVPAWMENKTYMDEDETGGDVVKRDPDGHASGYLREIAYEFYGGDDDHTVRMYSALFEAAERLDDAHQEWLERKVAGTRPGQGCKKLLTDKEAEFLNVILMTYCEDSDSSKATGERVDRLWNKLRNVEVQS